MHRSHRSNVRRATGERRNRRNIACAAATASATASSTASATATTTATKAATATANEAATPTATEAAAAAARADSSVASTALASLSAHAPHYRHRVHRHPPHLRHTPLPSPLSVLAPARADLVRRRGAHLQGRWLRQRWHGRVPGRPEDMEALLHGGGFY